MRSGDAYPWKPNAVEVVETHISWVFLAGDRVLKLKKPVAFSFVDYSTLARRKTACEDEVRLNRRLTNGIYLGVSAITAAGDRIEVDGEGPPVEWGTLMRRLPANGMLDHLLQQGPVARDIVSRISKRLIDFHRDAAEVCGDADGSATTQMQVVRDNLRDLEAFAESPLPSFQLDLVSEALRTFLDDAEELLNERVRQGWIREGHGDLRTDHICLDERGEIQIFDCVEFSRDIRCADVASDLAFLLVDLDRLGAPDIARTIVASYREAGLDLPEPLLRFYRGHRALVKVKVACLSSRDLPPEHRLGFLDEAATYLDLATAATATATKPFIIAMTGLSGTGKSVVAAALARALGIEIVSSDVVRRESAVPTEAPTGWQTGRYEPMKRANVYEKLIRRGRETVESGESVILDASFLESDWRRMAADEARAADVPLIFVETITDDDVVRRRLQERSARGDSPSEATVEIYERQRSARAASPPDVPSGTTLVQVDTMAEGPINLDAVFRELARLGFLELRREL
jgi:aminoglycoside phosphotransferase family enzyme/predicted kinase